MKGAEALRTPDDAFSEVRDFNYVPAYVDDLRGFEGLRMAYIDEGPREAKQLFLCVHGVPTWSFLYRKMIPVFLAVGGRVVAPDLFGFGRSDKPVDEKTHTFRFHRNALLRLIERLDLRSITLVCQGTGGVIALTIPPEMPHRFRRLIAMNTLLATGDVSIGPGFFTWRAFTESHPDFDLAEYMKEACLGLSDADAAAYGAPFPDFRYKAGLRAFSRIIPTEPNADGAAISRRARTWWRTMWHGPTFLALGVRAPVLGGPAMEYVRSVIRDAPDPVGYAEAGHYLPECGGEVARDALEAFAHWGIPA